MRSANGLMRCPICRDVIAERWSPVFAHMGTAHKARELYGWMWREHRREFWLTVGAVVAAEAVIVWITVVIIYSIGG